VSVFVGTTQEKTTYDISHTHRYSLDLRLLAHVESFVQHIKSKYNRLDMLINNAAQTIRRPPVRLLSAVYWLLFAVCWLLAAGCWLLAAGCWLLAAVCCLLTACC
jgi:NAD(P)-dependent dehydrogenase (short-subunit alcohol dehydrogenase family)